MSKVRVYGRVVGHGSHAVVTRGFVEVLEKHGLLAGVVGLDVMEDESAPAPAGAFAPHAVFTGPLDHLEQMMINARHTLRWVVVAPNSDRIPSALALRLQRVATHLIAPSEWAAEVLRREVLGLPVCVLRHAVDDEYVITRYRDDRTKFRVLHFSSSERQRKSTFELVQAWMQLRHAGELAHASLTLILDIGAYHRYVEQMCDGAIQDDDTVRVLTRLDLAPGGSGMAELLSSATLVCQPSRAEAFGLIPLEALACGTPVIATACTGHAEYLPAPGAVIVQHGADVASDDAPGARAPEVTVDAIAAALRYAYASRTNLAERARENAPQLHKRWSWEAQLEEFVSRVRLS